MPVPPVVYLGPSAPSDDAKRWLPLAEVRPPVRRGDLYRDRMLRYSVFVIIDGVFFQTRAVPPREIIDVIRDGGTVVGAGSMGALRAADCWPAGMRGIGTVYRLFRRGSLLSDDEVAVTFDAGQPYPAGSVPLVNVRYAMRRAVRSGTLTLAAAGRVVEVAAATYYADRRWSTMLDRAGVPRDLEAWVKDLDLKRMDAVRAMRAVGAMIDAEPSILRRPRWNLSPFVSSEERRERPPRAIGAAPSAHLKRQFGRWLTASGQYRQYTLRAQNALRDRDTTPSATGGRAPDTDWPWFADDPCVTLATQDQAVADQLWMTLERLGELDAAMFRFRAIREAAAVARRRSWLPAPSHRYVAENEIAVAHGFATWGALRDALNSCPAVRKRVDAYRDELAQAKRVRDALFRDSGRPFPQE